MSEEDDTIDPYDVPDPIHREAQHLMQNDLSSELESRALKPTGFWSDDARRLQIEFDKEYEIELEQMQEKKSGSSCASCSSGGRNDASTCFGT